jgi:hypothetical protein
MNKINKGMIKFTIVLVHKMIRLEFNNKRRKDKTFGKQ